jgi:uncharacterized protein (TIGR02271 family)
MAETQNLTGTIAAYFDDSNDAREAVEALHDAGFSSAHIGIAHRGPSSISETGTSSESSFDRGEKNHEFSTWDKVKNWFSGDEAEPYADERTRGDLATREITDPEAGTGYASSDLHGSFRSLDIPEEHSRYFSHRLGRDQNGAVVTVNAGTRRAEAEDILTQYGGDVASNAASYDYGDTGANATGYESGTGTASGATAGTYREETPENIQLLGEVLRVHKERINRGEVRIRKEVVTENQTVQVPVTREELVIERRPVNDTASADGSIGESEIRVPLSEERPSIDKSTVVREEVSVSKRPVEEVRDVTGEVRREELVVDDPTRKNDPNRKVA